VDEVTEHVTEHLSWVPPGCIVCCPGGLGCRVFEDYECTRVLGTLRSPLVFVVASVPNGNESWYARINFVVSENHIGWAYLSPGNVERDSVWDESNDRRLGI
jgi:hypothetical protein